MLWVKRTAISLLRRKGKSAFIAALPRNSILLDVGCGNNSAARVRALRPDLRYVGLDIDDYNQSPQSKQQMDEYLLAPPERFHEKIAEMPGRFDAVISSHNLEHCLKPFEVLHAMCRALKPGGRLYLAFPAEATRGFPSREGTLNFDDDPTHIFLPPWEKVRERIEACGLRVDVAIRQYRPWAYYLAGALLEPFSARSGRLDRHGALWAFWGFESVIRATRTH